ncbi:MAG: hypothetical protein NUV86_13030 [Candidatus Scalindua sp.]|nr:hypothetical protein [Candidatus Scalindua sp.]MCR4343583.1 hypothetical protein [Candidatus Scalindua sp.]
MAAKKPAKKTVMKTAKKTVVKLWTKAELSTLKKEYPNTDTQKLATKLTRTLEAVRFQAKKNGLKKTKSYMQSLYKAASKPATKKVAKPVAKKVVKKAAKTVDKKVVKKVSKKATKKRAACKTKR